MELKNEEKIAQFLRQQVYEKQDYEESKVSDKSY